MNTRRFGADGEFLAVEFLSSKGYTILNRNFRSKRGEVDIICECGETIAFVEVKRWSKIEASGLEQAIDRKKQMRIADAARHFLLQEPSFRTYRQRFDVVFIDADSRRIDHIEGAFESPWPG